MLKRIRIFRLLNFAALAIGGLFTGTGITSDWYTSLNQAPWTPPGWVFGAAWTTIMICFTLYMTFLYEQVSKKRVLVLLFAVQWILNVSWNPIFFKFQHITLGLVVITSLTAVVALLLVKYWNDIKAKSILLLPYLIWLCIATSLNAYILLNN